MEQTIQFIEQNIDGNGTNIDVLVTVPVDVINNIYKTGADIVELLDTAIREFKNTWDDWDTDSLVTDACNKVFGPYNWEFANAPFVVKF